MNQRSISYVSSSNIHPHKIPLCLLQTQAVVVRVCLDLDPLLLLQFNGTTHISLSLSPNGHAPLQLGWEPSSCTVPGSSGGWPRESHSLQPWSGSLTSHLLHNYSWSSVSPPSPISLVTPSHPHTLTPSPISHPHNSAGYTITKPSDLPPLSAEPRFLSITGVIISATLPSEYTSDQHNLSHTHNRYYHILLYQSLYTIRPYIHTSIHPYVHTSIHPYIYSICDLYSMQ